MMALGVGAARFLRRWRWWLKFHRPAGIGAAACLAAGLGIAVAMVSQSGEGQFKVPHAWLGLAAVMVGIAAPVTGHLQFKIKDKILQRRRRHRRLGYGAALMTLLSLLSGLVIAGII